MSIIIWLIVGGLAGWLAGMVVKGGGFGLIGDIIVGIVDGLIAGWLGILFPFVLAAGGYWRAMAAAAVSAAALAFATIVLFGTTPWTEFFHWLPLTSKALLSQDHTAWADHTEWYKFQSLFALVRLVGGGATLAWALQSALTVAVAIVLIAMWRSRQVAFELKAAGLAVGILLLRLPLRPRHSRRFRGFSRSAGHQNGLQARRNHRPGAHHVTGPGVAVSGRPGRPAGNRDRSATDRPARLRPLNGFKASARTLDLAFRHTGEPRTP
jgi:uncharacterized membrane protein YeaQ/YmgE (transglycosylase-associated protein family)